MKIYNYLNLKRMCLFLLSLTLSVFLSCNFFFGTQETTIDTNSALAIGILNRNVSSYTLMASIDSNQWEKDDIDNLLWKGNINKFSINQQIKKLGFRFNTNDTRYELNVADKNDKNTYSLNVHVYGMQTKPSECKFLQKISKSGFNFIRKNNFTIDGKKPIKIEFRQGRDGFSPVVRLFFNDNVLSEPFASDRKKTLYRLGILYKIKGNYKIQGSIEKVEWERTQIDGEEWYGKLFNFSVFYNEKKEYLQAKGFSEKNNQNFQQSFALEVPPKKTSYPSLFVYVYGFHNRPNTLIFQKSVYTKTKNKMKDISEKDFTINGQTPQRIELLETIHGKKGKHPAIKLYYNNKQEQLDSFDSSVQADSEAVQRTIQSSQSEFYSPNPYYKKSIGILYPQNKNFQVTGSIDHWTKINSGTWLGKIFTFNIWDKTTSSEYITQGFDCTDICIRDVSADSKSFSNKTSLHVYLHGLKQKPKSLIFFQNHTLNDELFHNMAVDNFRIGSIFPDKLEIGKKQDLHPVIHLYYKKQDYNSYNNVTIITEGYEKYKHALSNCYIVFYQNNKIIDQMPLNSQHFSKNMPLLGNITKVILASSIGSIHYKEIRSGHKMYRINLHQYAFKLKVQDTESKAISNSIVDIRVKKVSPFTAINKNGDNKQQQSKRSYFSYLNPWYVDNENKNQYSDDLDATKDTFFSIFSGRTDSQGNVSFISFNQNSWDELLVSAYAKGYYLVKNQFALNGILELIKYDADIKEYNGKITITSDSNIPINNALVGISSEKTGIVYFTNESNDNGEVQYSFSSISDNKEFQITVFKYGFKQSEITVKTEPYREYSFSLKLKLLSIKRNQVSFIILNEQDVQSFIKAKNATLDFLNYIHWSTTAKINKIKVAAGFDDTIKELQSISDIEKEIAKPLSFCALKDQFKQTVDKQNNISNIIYIMNKRFLLSVPDQWDDFFQVLDQTNKYLTIFFIIIGSKSGDGYNDIDAQRLAKKTGGSLYYCNQKNEIIKILYKIFNKEIF